MKKNYIDMHIHTNNSDGYFSPQEIIDMSYDNETSIIAITDHDSIDGIAQFQKSLKSNMVGINGVEISSVVNYKKQKYKLHILGYGFDLNSNSILELNNLMRDKRKKSHYEVLCNVENIIGKLPESAENLINFNKYCWFDREVIRILEREKISEKDLKNIKFYYQKNRFSYGNNYELNIDDVIDIIHKAGGLVVLAHPTDYKYDFELMKELIYYLKKKGIDGVEVFQSDCSLNNTLKLMALNKKLNLLNSVGSDFHRNINSDGREIGKGINNNLCVENISIIDELKTKKLIFKGNK